MRVPLVLVAHPSVPAKDLKELIAPIKAAKGGFQWASAGNGTPQHLSGELFRTAAKLDTVNAATLKYMKQPEFQKVLTDTGSEYVGDTPENFTAFTREEAAKWAKLAKEIGATVE